MLRRSSCVLLLVAALSGCPDAPPPGGTGNATPTPTPTATTGTEAPAPTPSPTPAPTTATPTPITIEPPAAPAPGEPITLQHGRVLQVTDELRVGNSGVVGPVAHLEVLIGEYCYSAPASVGDLIAVGRGALRVEAIDGVESAVTVRWERAHDGSATHEPRPADGGGLLLRELALFVLEDGTRVGVGPVTGDEVMINIFPPGYDKDPGVGYARERVRAGAKVGDTAFTLTRIAPRAPDRSWGTIVLTRS
jgi:hypothetical protein